MTTYTDPHPGLKGTDTVFEPCGRCAGDGLYHGPTNAAWENGSGKGALPYCFWCNGAGQRAIKVSSVRARARREAKAAADHAAHEQRFQEALIAWREAGFEEAVARGHRALEPLHGGDPLARKLRAAVEAIELPFTAVAAGIEEVDAVIAEIEARAAARVPLEEGRREVIGFVKSLKTVESVYGVTYKMLVEQTDGGRVWGTVPAAIDPKVGDKVALIATVQRSDDDPSFGFYSRPTKPAILQEAA